MRIGLIINCMGHDKKAYQDAQNEYFFNVRPKINDCNDIEVLFADRDWFDSWEKPPHADFPEIVDENAVSERRNANNKGQVVCMSVIGFCKSSCDVVFHIDDGSFYQKDIIRIIQELQTQNEAILTIRNISSIDEFRELLEKFEISLVKSIYSENEYGIIPDGQSGCWAFKILKGDIKTDNGIKLSAKGYEIELDVLTEVLRLKRRIVWSPIIVNPNRKSSQYDSKNSIPKLIFLCNKLNISKDKTLELFSEFKKQNQDKIEKHKSEFEIYENHIRQAKF